MKTNLSIYFLKFCEFQWFNIRCVFNNQSNLIEEQSKYRQHSDSTNSQLMRMKWIKNLKYIRFFVQTWITINIKSIAVKSPEVNLCCDVEVIEECVYSIRVLSITYFICTSNSKNQSKCEKEEEVTTNCQYVDKKQHERFLKVVETNEH